MIQRPPLTNLQKKSFEDQFHSIVMEASEDIRAIWLANPEIVWYPAGNLYAITSGAQTMLKGRLFDRYIALTNKIKNGTI